jgi:hypothetical protein
MATFSTNLGITLPADGEFSGTWGQITNNNLGTLLEQAISGYVTHPVATGTDTTISIPNGATGVARNMFLQLTGTGGASTNLIVPANRKLYFIYNSTAGQVTVKVLGQPGVSVPAGAKMLLVCNGTDVIEAVNTFGSVTLAGGSAALAINGAYLAAANTLGFATNSITRGNINGSGAWTIAAPSSGNHAVNLLSGSNGIAFTTGAVTANLWYDGSVYYQFGTTTGNGLKLMVNNSAVVTLASGGGMVIPVITAGEAASLVANGAAYTPSSTISASTSTLTINTKTSNVFNINLVSTVNVGTFTINNTVLFDGQTINLFLTQPSSGTAATLAWPAGFKWPGGTAPTISSTLGAVDLVVATYRSATGFWYATISKAFS